MKNNFSSIGLAVFFLLYYHMAYSQMQWNISMGGGLSTSSGFLNDHSLFTYDPGPLLKIGSSISSSMGKETLAGWELGLNLVREEFKWTSKISEIQEGKISDWYVQVPLSLTLDLFERVGFHLGGSISRRLTNLDTYAENVRAWIPSTYIGVYFHINPRFRLDLTTYLDVLPRNKELMNPGYATSESRGLGGTINIRYRIFK